MWLNGRVSAASVWPVDHPDGPNLKIHVQWIRIDACIQGFGLLKKVVVLIILSLLSILALYLPIRVDLYSH